MASQCESVTKFANPCYPKTIPEADRYAAMKRRTMPGAEGRSMGGNAGREARGAARGLPGKTLTREGEWDGAA